VAAALWCICRDPGKRDATPVNGLPQPRDEVALQRRDDLERQLRRKTNDELKNYLRLNNQLLSGAKAELARRVADGAIFGALPQCPRCGGHLHPDGDYDLEPVVRCRKLNREREPCGYEASWQELEPRPFIGAEQLT